MLLIKSENKAELQKKGPESLSRKYRGKVEQGINKE